MLCLLNLEQRNKTGAMNYEESVKMWKEVKAYRVGVNKLAGSPRSSRDQVISVIEIIVVLQRIPYNLRLRMIIIRPS
jgi:hypothetical protein